MFCRYLEERTEFQNSVNILFLLSKQQVICYTPITRGRRFCYRIHSAYLNNKVNTTNMLVRTGSVRVIFFCKMNEDTEKSEYSTTCDPA